MRYTWKPDKHRRNLKDHGIAFEDAVRIFEGPTVEQVDDRFDYDEVRMYAIGFVNGLENKQVFTHIDNGLEITGIYTDEDNGQRHIISAWRSEPHERRSYWKNVKG